MKHAGSGRQGARAGAPRAAVIDRRHARAGALREALTAATLALLGAAALGLAGCGGGAADAGDEAPARTGQASGEVAVAGATAGAPDSNALAGTAGSGVGGAGDATGSINTPGEGTLQSGNPSDAAVRSLIDHVNATEVEVSQLALQKGQSAEVRRYAQAMITAHRQPALDRAVDAAGINSASDLIVPMRELHEKTLKQLQGLPTGRAFDEAFMTGQVQHHQGALQALERAETAARDATLTDRLRRMQSEVERHLAEARRVQASITRNAPR